MTIFLTERFTNLQATFQNKKKTGVQKQPLADVSRSSHQRCSVKKGLRPATSPKKESLAQVFSCDFSQIYKNTFFTEHLWATASVFYKISVLESFATFIGKHLSWSHFLIKLHALRGSITSVFLWFLWHFQEHLIIKHLAQQK